MIVTENLVKLRSSSIYKKNKSVNCLFGNVGNGGAIYENIEELDCPIDSDTVNLNVIHAPGLTVFLPYLLYAEEGNTIFSETLTVSRGDISRTEKGSGLSYVASVFCELCISASIVSTLCHDAPLSNE